MNSFNISGIIGGFGTKGSKYPKLWISIKINTGENIFVNFYLDSNTSSKKGKMGTSLMSELEKGKAIFISDLTITPIKFSKPDGNGGWIEEEKIGLNGNLSNIRIFDTEKAPVNCGFLEGKVTKVGDSNKKIIVEQSYRLPSKNEWKTRPIPVLIDDNISYMVPTIKVNDRAFINGKISVKEDKMFIVAKQIII